MAQRKRRKVDAQMRDCLSLYSKAIIDEFLRFLFCVIFDLFTYFCCSNISTIVGTPETDGIEELAKIIAQFGC